MKKKLTGFGFWIVLLAPAINAALHFSSGSTEQYFNWFSIVGYCGGALVAMIPATIIMLIVAGIAHKKVKEWQGSTLFNIVLFLAGCAFWNLVEYIVG